MVKFTASAPGQVFFFGEHSVVYGKPAIGAAIGLRTRVTAERRKDNLVRIRSENFGNFEGRVNRDGSIRPNREGDFGKLKYAVKTVEHFFRRFGTTGTGVELSISSQVPPRSGMSSSTALLVSELAALGAAFDAGVKREGLFELAIPIQREIHGGAASGTEIIPSVYGGFVEVASGKPAPLKMDTKADLVVGDTEIPVSTAAMVRKVAALRARHPAILDKIFDEMATVAEEGKRALMGGNLEKVGELMNVNHGFLSAIGVSGPELESLIFAARSAGALGAKLSGGGGGKCMVALCPGRKAHVASAINRAGGRAIVTEIGGPGLEISVVH